MSGKIGSTVEVDVDGEKGQKLTFVVTAKNTKLSAAQWAELKKKLQDV